MKILPVNTSKTNNQANKNINFGAKKIKLTKQMESEVAAKVKSIVDFHNEPELNPKKALERIEKQIVDFEQSEENKRQLYSQVIEETPVEKIPFGPATSKSWDEHWTKQEYIKNLKNTRDKLREKLGLPKLEDNASSQIDKKVKSKKLKSKHVPPPFPEEIKSRVVGGEQFKSRVVGGEQFRNHVVGNIDSTPDEEHTNKLLENILRSIKNDAENNKKS